MAHPVAPSYLHTFSIPTPFPVGPFNVYLAEGNPLTLVDVGPRYERARKSVGRVWLRPGRPAAHRPDVDSVNYFLAISKVIGHLQWLEIEGQVASDERGGVARWRRAGKISTKNR